MKRHFCYHSCANAVRFLACAHMGLSVHMRCLMMTEIKVYERGKDIPPCGAQRRARMPGWYWSCKHKTKVEAECKVCEKLQALHQSRTHGPCPRTHVRAHG